MQRPSSIGAPLGRARKAFCRAAAAAALTACLVGQAHAGPSGLPWASGAICSGSEFVAWRGRALDIAIGYAPWKTGWDDMVGYFAKGGAKSVAGKAPEVSIGVGLLAKGSDGRFGECAAGRFDQHFRAIGQHLSRQGLGRTHIRLGWEASGNWYPWSIGNQVEPYKACFRRAVDALRSGAPGLRITWHMAKKGKLSFPVTSAYPGDAHVDEIAISYYDRYPAHPSEAAWAKQYEARHNGGPYGLGTWLAFAKSRGKKFAVPEWGIADGWPGGGSDNPLFIRKMHDFFRGNASSIAYEAYFNCPMGNGAFMIYPSRHNPRASASYLAAWK